MAKFPNTVVFNVEFDWKDMRREMVEGFWSIFEQVANSLENILDDLDAEDQPEGTEDNSTKEDVMASDTDPSSWFDSFLDPDAAVKSVPVYNDRGPCSSSHYCDLWCGIIDDCGRPNHTSWNDVKDASHKTKHDQPMGPLAIDNQDIADIVVKSAIDNAGEESGAATGSFAAMIVYNLLQEYLDQDFVQDFNQTTQELNIGVELIETDDRDSLDDEESGETQDGMTLDDFMAKFFPTRFPAF